MKQKQDFSLATKERRERAVKGRQATKSDKKAALAAAGNDLLFL